uniref:Riboflavin transporter n=1 Tax=Branchiostoma floridae TaxID=7739 RepID=C3YFK3_BRAFL|eukprot:XP_002604956.1 hypothetical protein BRAFLDRAFT_92596 [Branchiostoma floridae]
MEKPRISIPVYILVCLFGVGSWIDINGLWVELPIIVQHAPEGWSLPSYMAVIIQLANIGPIAVTLANVFCGRRVSNKVVIYIIVTVGAMSCFLLPFFWKHTSVVAGANHSTALLTLTFLLAFVDCTSSVTFLPFMTLFSGPYLTSYFIGEGMSGLLPSLVALGQGNFFWFLFAMMLICGIAFVLLNHLPLAKKEHVGAVNATDSQNDGFSNLGHSSVADDHREDCLITKKRGLSRGGYIYLLCVQAWVNALSNGVLPSIQSYSCLPYGNTAYHLAVTLGNMANPLACFISFFLPTTSFLLVGVLSLAGTAVGAYILALAAMSPTPVLLGTDGGVFLVILAWILVVGLFTYVKVTIGSIFRQEGQRALLWCGAVMQAGSCVGAIVIFLFVNVFPMFQQNDACEL